MKVGLEKGLRKFQRSDHHGSRTKRVTWPFEIMPLDAIEFANMLSLGVVHPVQVRWATGIKPPACR